MTQIDNSLKRFQKRVRLLRAWRGLAVGGCIGAGLSAGWAILDYFGVSYTNWLLLGIPVLACILGGTSFGLFRPVSPVELADSIDRRAGLRNRLRTAMEGEPTDFAEPLQADALDHLKTVQPKRAFPVRVSRWHGALVALMGVAALIFLLGNSPLLLNSDQKRDRTEMQEAAKQVQRVAKPLQDLATKQETSDEERKLAERMKRLSADLERGRIPKQDALAKANELAKQADDLSRDRYEKSENSLLKADDSLAKAALDKMEKETGEKIDPSLLSKTDDELTADKRDLQMKMDKLTSQLDGKSSQMSESERAAMRSHMNQMQKAASGQQMSQGERKALAKALKDAMNSEAGKNLSQADRETLKDLIKKLENGVSKLTPQEQRALQELAKALQKQMDGLSPEERKALQRQMQQMQKQMQQLRLSEKAKQFLKELMQRPEMREIAQMMAKLKMAAQAGKQGQQKMTAEQMRQLSERLEKLAEMLKDEKAMKAFLEKLKEAVKNAKMAGQCAGIVPGLMGAFGMQLGAQQGGPGAPSEDIWTGNTGVVPKTDKNKDFKYKTNEVQVNGDRGDKGTETYVELKGPSGVGQRSKTPYSAVLPKYRKSAEKAIDRQEIPKSQQKRVRDYFDALGSKN